MAFAPTQQKITIKLPIFDGGLNTKYTDVSTPLNASPDCQNILFDEFGAIRTTPGFSKVFTLASAPIDCLGVYNNPSLNQLMLVAGCNGSLWAQISTATFSVISGSTGVYTSPSKFLDIINVNSYAVFSNGYITPQKYDGNALYQFGIPAPVTGSVGVTISAGVLNGVYKYAMTYVNSDLAESDYTKIATASAMSGKQVTLSNLPVGPASYGVSYKNLYRTTAAGSAIFWLVTAMTAAQTSVVDNNTDANLVEQAPLDQGLPPKCKFLTYYHGRVWAAGDPSAPYRLYFSEAGAPETWPSTNFIDIEKGDGLPISGIEAWGNSIIIHKNDGLSFGCIYLLYIADATGSSDTSNWYVFKSPAAFSSVAHKSQAFFKNVMFYINRNGAYAFTGQDLARTTADSDFGRFATDNLTYDIDPDVKQFNSSYLDGACAVQYDNKVWLSVPVGETVGVPNQNNTRLYVYDFIRLDSSKLGVWSRLSYPGISDFQVAGGTLYGGDYSGHIYSLDHGTDFDGATIDPYFLTAPISGLTEHRDNSKVFRILYITHDLPGNWLLTVDWYVDFANTPSGTATIDLGAYIPTWGRSIWGAFSWGGTSSRRSRIILSNAVGKIIQFKFSVTGVGSTFKVKEIELDYNLRSKRG
jgi:hypothetical protein